MSSSNRSILVVDDDPALCTLVGALFTRQGYVVETSPDGEVALPVILDGAHDAVLLDLMIPRFSGVDIVRCLRIAAPEVLSRIIVLTAVATRTLDPLHELSDAYAVVRKPFDISDLSNLVIKCIEAQPERAPVSWQGAATKVQAQLQSESAAAGAAGAIVAAVRRSDVELLWTFGYPEDQKEPFRRMPLGAPYPICESIRSGRPIWISSRDQALLRYPGLADVMKRNGSEAIAVVPALRHNEVVGAFGWTFTSAQRFPKEQQDELLTIAESRGACLPLFAPRA